MLVESIDYKLPEKEKKSEYVESKFDEIAQRYDPVSYTHLRAPRDLSTSRMPSSA